MLKDTNQDSPALFSRESLAKVGPACRVLHTASRRGPTVPWKQGGHLVHQDSSHLPENGTFAASPGSFQVFANGSMTYLIQGLQGSGAPLNGDPPRCCSGTCKAICNPRDWSWNRTSRRSSIPAGLPWRRVALVFIIRCGFIARDTVPKDPLGAAPCPCPAMAHLHSPHATLVQGRQPMVLIEKAHRNVLQG